MFDCGYLAVCTERDLGWKRVHRIVHKRSHALEQFFFSAKLTEFFLLVSTMTRKVTYEEEEDLKRLQEGQSALAANPHHCPDALKEHRRLESIYFVGSQEGFQVRSSHCHASSFSSEVQL